MAVMSDGTNGSKGEAVWLGEFGTGGDGTERSGGEGSYAGKAVCEEEVWEERREDEGARESESEGGQRGARKKGQRHQIRHCQRPHRVLEVGGRQ